MPVKRTGQLTLMSRIILFLVVFGGLLLLQAGIGWVQSRYILKPLEERTERIQTISRFLSDTERCMSALEDHRWDYGDAQILVDHLQTYLESAAIQRDAIGGALGEVSEEYYLLSNAAQITCDTLTGELAEMVDDLSAGRPRTAAQQYYRSVVPCGTYLLQYTRQLLERAILDNHDLFASLKSLESRLSVLRAVVLLLCVLLGVTLTVSVVSLLRSVHEIAGAAQHISRGEFDTPDVAENRRDEMGRMAHAFNEMKRSTKQYVETLQEKNEIERELHAKETETLELQGLMEREKLQQLRSQINPHFLFNTLNMIMYTARQEGAEKTGSLIGSMSQLFRYALGSNEAWEPLSKEVRIVNDLYAIYHTRFGDRMTLEWHISPELDVTELLSPPFILQPLVENAFQHGLSPKEGDGRIDIHIWSEEKFLRIRVRDDGVGMTGEELAALRATLESKEIPGEHIGMYNVAARLRLLGGECGMEVTSRAGEGTTTELKLPLVPVEEEEEEADEDEDPDCG